MHGSSHFPPLRRYLLLHHRVVIHQQPTTVPVRSNVWQIGRGRHVPSSNPSLPEGGGRLLDLPVSPHFPAHLSHTTWAHQAFRYEGRLAKCLESTSGHTPCTRRRTVPDSPLGTTPCQALLLLLRVLGYLLHRDWGGRLKGLVRVVDGSPDRLGMNPDGPKFGLRRQLVSGQLPC